MAVTLGDLIDGGGIGDKKVELGLNIITKSDNRKQVGRFGVKYRTRLGVCSEFDSHKRLQMP